MDRATCVEENRSKLEEKAAMVGEDSMVEAQIMMKQFHILPSSINGVKSELYGNDVGCV